MNIIVGGVVSLLPFSAGMAWNWMHLVVGLRKLGHEVHYIEEIAPEWCIDAAGQPCKLEQSVNHGLFRKIMARFELTKTAYQIYDRGAATYGRSPKELATLACNADLLFNISGHVKSDFILGNVRRRAYLDQDPVYTQLWHSEYGADLNFDQHDVFFTVGLNIGTAYSPIPDCGINWHHHLPPVVLEYWPPDSPAIGRRFTTIASWHNFQKLAYRGRWYTAKYAEFCRFASLPRHVDQEFEVTMRRHRAEEEGILLLKENGWTIRRAPEVSELADYQSYIQGSYAEIGIAKNAYVKGHSGWFGDRSTHYLAAGKPVLAQSTGFERHLPTGRGLLTFSNMEEAVAGVQAINRDYQGHCRVAREFAEAYLDYQKILPRMLERCFH